MQSRTAREISALSTRESIDAAASYYREVALLRNLHHHRLPQIYDHFADQHHWYVVMQYIEGQTLEEDLQTAPEREKQTTT